MNKLKKLIRNLGLKNIDYIVIAIAVMCLAWLVNDAIEVHKIKSSYEYLAGAE